MNESRPGVTSAILSPQQAMTYMDKITEKIPNLSVVGIAGPGDPFANPEETMETFRLVRAKYPEVLLCVASNGLMAAPYAKELASLKLSHISITINAIDPKIGAKIYSWVRDGKKIYRGEEGALRLWERQQEALAAFKQAGVVLKVNMILIPGINDHHVSAVAIKMKELGVDIINPLPFYPVANSEFASLEEPGTEMVLKARKEVEEHVPVMTHCMRCRADAAGILGKDSEDGRNLLVRCSQMSLDPRDDRPYVAVASREGILVNQHLGEASKFYIFKKEEEKYFLETVRDAPLSGGGNERWEAVSKTLKDCKVILVSRVGDQPKKYLQKNGIKVLEMNGMISYGLPAVFEGKALPKELQIEAQPCSGSLAADSGHNCSGNGMGCM